MGKRSGTAAGLIEYLESEDDDGRIGTSVRRSQVSAVKAVLGVNSNWEDLRVTDIDPTVAFDVFVGERGAEYTAETLATYQRRFEQALGQYRAWLGVRKPPPSIGVFPESISLSERGPGVRSGGSVGTFRNSRTGRIRPMTAGGEGWIVGKESLGIGSDPTIPHRFPIRPGLLAKVELPVDLTRLEAERLAAFIYALAVEERDREGGDRDP